MRNFVFLLIATISFNSFVGAVEHEYMTKAMNQVFEEIQTTDEKYEKAMLFDNLDKWFKLLAKLNIPAESKRMILQQTKDQINILSEEFLEYLKDLYKNSEGETIDIIYKGQPAKAFLNIDVKRFEQEVLSYNQYHVFEPIEVSADNINDLKINTTYNFIVTPEGQLKLGELQEYDLLFEGDKKILLAPNHAILSEGKPLMSAGEITIIGDDEFKLWCIGMTSGHYHPSWESRQYLINSLVELGVPQEQIITLGFHIAKLPWKLLEDDKNLNDKSFFDRWNPFN